MEPCFVRSDAHARVSPYHLIFSFSSRSYLSNEPSFMIIGGREVDKLLCPRCEKLPLDFSKIDN